MLDLLLQLFTAYLLFQGFHRIAGRVQGNEMAGLCVVLMLGGDPRKQNAIVVALRLMAGDQSVVDAGK